MQTAPSPRPIPVRKMDFPFKDDAVPRWWLHDNPLMTHAANGLNLLFPAGERFFIRSVKHYLDALDDPELRGRVRGFFGQEGRHGHEHERANRMLERQGYELDAFLRRYERIGFEVIEPLAPPALRLAVTAAAEHFTATMAAQALSDEFMDGAHPVMRALLRWHAAEEIEHKSVAFDVFERVDGRYSVRVAGLVMATVLLIGFWIAATRMLMAQEGLSEEERARWRAHAREVEARHGRDRLDVFAKAIAEYLRPGFHPDDRDDYDLARAYLEQVGAA